MSGLNPNARPKINQGITEYFYPSFSAPSRQVTQLSAVFSLVSTIIGGGVLSLPFALAKCGIVLGGVMFLLAAALNGFTMDLLINSSRRTGLESYERLAFGAFGTPATLMVAAMIFIMTWIVCVGDIVLLGDLIVPLSEWVVDYEMGSSGRKLSQIAMVVLVFPLTLKQSFDGLRYASLFSVVSVVFLCAVLFMKCVDGNLSEFHEVWTVDDNMRKHSHMVGMKLESILWPSSFTDVVYVFPVIGVAFGCHVNLLPVHQELLNPSRKRLRLVTCHTMMVCCILFLIASYSGYLYALEHTCGNILLNFNANDAWINCGRLFLTVVLLMSLPMLVLPCRLAVKKFVENATMWYYKHRILSIRLIQVQDIEADNVSQDENWITPGAMTPRSKMTELLKQSHGKVMSQMQLCANTQSDCSVQCTEYSSSPTGHSNCDAISTSSSGENDFFKTLIIVSGALVVSMFVPSIMVVWTVMGASVCFAVSLWVPGMLYLKLRTERPCTLYKFLAVAVTIFGFAVTGLCSWQAVVRINQPACELV